MVGLPRLHGKLGAKRVEVTVGEEREVQAVRAKFENVANNNT